MRPQLAWAVHAFVSRDIRDRPFGRELAVKMSARAKPSMSRPTGRSEEIEHRRRHIDDRAARQAAAFHVRTIGEQKAVRRALVAAARGSRCRASAPAAAWPATAAACRTARPPAARSDGRIRSMTAPDLGIDITVVLLEHLPVLPALLLRRRRQRHAAARAEGSSGLRCRAPAAAAPRRRRPLVFQPVGNRHVDASSASGAAPG